MVVSSVVLGLRDELHARRAGFVERVCHTARWSRAGLAGRLVELTGNARLTAAAGLVHEAQREGEPAAWIAPDERLPYPPHLDANGVDLAALVVIRAPVTKTAHAAERVLRSGAIGLVVVELGDAGDVPLPLQSRLLGLASKYDAAVVFLQASARPLGSLVAVRAAAERTRVGAGGFRCVVKPSKDKSAGPTWQHVEVCRGPLGMR